MNLTERYGAIMIKNHSSGNIFIDGKRVGRGQSVVVRTGTANTFLGSITKLVSIDESGLRTTLFEAWSLADCMGKETGEDGDN